MMMMFGRSAAFAVNAWPAMARANRHVKNLRCMETPPRKDCADLPLLPPCDDRARLLATPFISAASSVMTDAQGCWHNSAGSIQDGQSR
jgi:hypothetical protein